MKQCAVLYITSGRENGEHTRVLSQLGFDVRQMDGWPEDDRLGVQFEAVLVNVHDCRSLPEIAAHLRAKRKFGRRVLLALTPENTPPAVQRDAKVSGFDVVLPQTVDGKTLAAHILKALRQRPELRCGIPRRPAA